MNDQWVYKKDTYTEHKQSDGDNRDLNVTYEDVMAMGFHRDQYGFDYFESMEDKGYDKANTTDIQKLDWSQYTTGDWRKEDHNRIVLRSHNDEWIQKPKTCEVPLFDLQKFKAGYFTCKNENSDFESETYYSEKEVFLDVISEDSYGNTEYDRKLTEEIMALGFHRDAYGWEYYQTMGMSGYENELIHLNGRLIRVNWDEYSTGNWTKEKRNFNKLNNLG